MTLFITIVYPSFMYVKVQVNMTELQINCNCLKSLQTRNLVSLQSTFMMDKAEQNITVDYKYFLGTCSTQNKRLTNNFKVIHSHKSVFD